MENNDPMILNESFEGSAMPKNGSIAPQGKNRERQQQNPSLNDNNNQGEDSFDLEEPDLDYEDYYDDEDMQGIEGEIKNDNGNIDDDEEDMIEKIVFTGRNSGNSSNVAQPPKPETPQTRSPIGFERKQEANSESFAANPFDKDQDPFSNTNLSNSAMWNASSTGFFSNLTSDPNPNPAANPILTLNPNLLPATTTTTTTPSSATPNFNFTGSGPFAMNTTNNPLLSKPDSTFDTLSMVFNSNPTKEILNPFAPSSAAATAQKPAFPANPTFPLSYMGYRGAFSTSSAPSATAQPFAQAAPQQINNNGISGGSTSAGGNTILEHPAYGESFFSFIKSPPNTNPSGVGLTSTSGNQNPVNLPPGLPIPSPNTNVNPNFNSTFSTGFNPNSTALFGFANYKK